MYNQYRLDYFLNIPEEYYLKVIAGTTMYLFSPTWSRGAIVFHGNFGPPDVFRLGRLERTE